MSVNVEAMVREGINALRANKKDEARALLMRAVELDQFNEQGWLWLAAAVDDPEDRRTCLENVLAINPNNENARRGMNDLQKPASPPPPPPAPAQTSSPGSAPFTSVEWGAPETSSPSAAYTPGPEPDYDNWLVNLNLPATGDERPESTTPGAAPGTPSSLFDDDDDALFTDGPFSSPSLDVQEAAPPPKAGAKAIPLSPPPPPAKDTGRSGKGAAPILTKQIPPSREETSFLGRMGGGEDEDEDMEPMAEGDDDLFVLIPKEIKATRLPGTKGSLQIVPLILLLVMLAANAAAVVFLVSQLTRPTG